jgi:hypothetical protein
LFLNSSNNTWTSTYTQSDGTVSPRTGSETNSWFRVKTTRTDNGIYLYDKIESNNALTYFGINVHKIETTASANNLSFGATNFSGKDESPTYHNDGYYSVNGLSTLQQAIDNCLKAAGSAYQRAVNAENNAKAYAKTYADGGFVTKATYNKHTHSFSVTSNKRINITADEAKAGYTNKLTGSEFHYTSTDKSANVQRGFVGFVSEDDGEWSTDTQDYGLVVARSVVSPQAFDVTKSVTQAGTSGIAYPQIQ